MGAVGIQNGETAFDPYATQSSLSGRLYPLKLLARQ